MIVLVIAVLLRRIIVAVISNMTVNTSARPGQVGRRWPQTLLASEFREGRALCMPHPSATEPGGGSFVACLGDQAFGASGCQHSIACKPSPWNPVADEHVPHVPHQEYIAGERDKFGSGSVGRSAWKERQFPGFCAVVPRARDHPAAKSTRCVTELVIPRSS